MTTRKAEALQFVAEPTRRWCQSTVLWEGRAAAASWPTSCAHGSTAQAKTDSQIKAGRPVADRRPSYTACYMIDPTFTQS